MMHVMINRSARNVRESMIERAERERHELGTKNERQRLCPVASNRPKGRGNEAGAAVLSAHSPQLIAHGRWLTSMASEVFFSISSSCFLPIAGLAR